MKRSRFSEEQIIAILKEQETGMATADVCRRHGISSPTFYKYQAKSGGAAAASGRWAPGRRWFCRMDPTSAGRWTSSLTR